jgi:hypothetical protein
MTKTNLPKCKLIGTDGDMFFLIGWVWETLRSAGLQDRAKEFYERSMNCVSYDDVLQLCFEFVDVE